MEKNDKKRNPVIATVSGISQKNIDELFEKKLLSFDCPKCGGQGGPTDIGKEFYIESIEIE